LATLDDADGFLVTMLDSADESLSLLESVWFTGPVLDALALGLAFAALRRVGRLACAGCLRSCDRPILAMASDMSCDVSVT
jgi:hypothetical protein